MARQNSSTKTSSSESKKADAFLNIGLKDAEGNFKQVGKYGIPLFSDDPIHAQIIALLGKEIKVYGKVNSATRKHDDSKLVIDLA